MNYTDRELLSRCLELSGMIKKYRNQFIALLPEVNQRQLYKKQGMHSIFEFGAKLAGLNYDTIRRVLKLKENLKTKPILDSLFISGEVGWSKLEVANKIPIDENQLAKILPTISKASLTTMIQDSRIQKVDNAGVEFENFTTKLDPRLISQMKVLKYKLEQKHKTPLTWNETLKEMVKVVEKELIKTPKPAKQNSKSRYIPIETRAKVLHKFNQLCSHQNCSNPATTLHHQIPYSISRNHESIIPLCKNHHDIVHHQEDTYINRKYQSHKLHAINKRNPGTSRNQISQHFRSGNRRSRNRSATLLLSYR